MPGHDSNESYSDAISNSSNDPWLWFVCLLVVQVPFLHAAKHINRAAASFAVVWAIFSEHKSRLAHALGYEAYLLTYCLC
eukprot:scaffold200_cov173-Amphora_coffeaeformis.AAC.14